MANEEYKTLNKRTKWKDIILKKCIFYDITYLNLEGVLRSYF